VVLYRLSPQPVEGIQRLHFGLNMRSLDRMPAVQHLTHLGVPQQRLKAKANQLRLPSLKQCFPKSPGRLGILEPRLQPGHGRIKHQRLGRRFSLSLPMLGRLNDGLGFGRLGTLGTAVAIYGRPSNFLIFGRVLGLGRRH
jgi:hypothetical protein